MLRMDERFVQNAINEAGGMDEIKQAINAIQDYRVKQYYPKKSIRLNNWDPCRTEIEEIVISVFTAVLVNECLTYQAAAGMLNHKINMDDTVDRVKTISEIIGLISLTGLINVERRGSGQSILITTDYTVSDIPSIDKHGLVLNRPQLVERNWDPDQGSMILGGKLNFHEKNLCLDHLNRMNQIPLKLNIAFIEACPEEPKSTFIKASDSPAKAAEKMHQFRQFAKDSSKKYMEIINGKNRAYLNHKYCTRGRTYAVGYYINTQGASYKKASLELYNKEFLNNL